jgi:HPt (histidine-containing phosphotransfer) domain-containing protein
MDTSANTSGADRLVSQLLVEDPRLRDIVQEFVDNLATRIDELKQAHETLDWELLTTLTHRLKGAAGSYGYPDISKLCAEMERELQAHQAEQFGRWIADLADFTTAARAGLGEPT